MSSFKLPEGFKLHRASSLNDCIRKMPGRDRDAVLRNEFRLAVGERAAPDGFEVLLQEVSTNLRTPQEFYFITDAQDEIVCAALLYDNHQGTKYLRWLSKSARAKEHKLATMILREIMKDCERQGAVLATDGFRVSEDGAATSLDKIIQICREQHADFPDLFIEYTGENYAVSGAGARYAPDNKAFSDALGDLPENAAAKEELPMEAADNEWLEENRPLCLITAYENAAPKSYLYFRDEKGVVLAALAFEEQEDRLVVHHLAVRPEARGNGYAGTLMRSFAKRAAGRGKFVEAALHDAPGTAICMKLYETISRENPDLGFLYPGHSEPVAVSERGAYELARLHEFDFNVMLEEPGTRDARHARMIAPGNEDGADLEPKGNG